MLPYGVTGLMALSSPPAVCQTRQLIRKMANHHNTPIRFPPPALPGTLWSQPCYRLGSGKLFPWWTARDWRLSKGIPHVIVNGLPVVDDYRRTDATSGRALMRR